MVFDESLVRLNPLPPDPLFYLACIMLFFACFFLGFKQLKKIRWRKLFKLEKKRIRKREE